MLWYANPGRAETLLGEAEKEVAARFHRYQQLAAMEWTPAKEETEE
jgi:hypothetical protein